ncbi:SDR family oxidoreductase [Fulvivirga kasyanovii]|uniref:SDR family oxidoreductase n=1 Tax=Fulvivirga kasyanovii TaxID=396812 RepID=A0ABW9RQA4_9BACT|nr:SDR family oxidoreductase [Fulvivirga kasyanovii]MTI25474.1 SDR family oxidoreductase [Fulvivirga kasyanovii]
MSKTWFITGTSSGLGNIMMKKLLERGDKVFATLRNVELLDDLRQKYPNTLETAHLELTDKHEINTVVDKAFNAFGKIDVVVSNAGYGIFGAVEELTDEMIVHQIEVNLLGSIRLIKAVIPYLRSQPTGGHVIQVSSEGGQIAYPGFSLYHASKWGIEGFVESINHDLESFNIHFTIAEPGPTGTSFASSINMANKMEEYNHTSVQEIRDLINEGFGQLDNAEEVVDKIIASNDQRKPPLRIAIGDRAKTNIKKHLKERLQSLE